MVDVNQLNLNREQKEAVTSTEGPVLIVAGAGSGKTRVLTTRIAYLIDNIGCPGHRILAITFTNIAAREMRQRIDMMLNYHSRSLICTYHSLCLRILREDIDQLKNGKRDFRILDEEEKISLIKQIYHDWNINSTFGKRCKPKLMISFIDEIQIETAKDDKDIWSLSYRSTPSIDSYIKKNHLFNNEDKGYIKGIYQEYQKRKMANNWLNFNDLIIVCNKLLLSNTEVALKWSKKFDYILVDEFQDTDQLQFEILTNIVNKNQNVFAVGDPDQTIYEWRGAYSGVFKDFEHTFNNTKIIFLNKNYRSTPYILDVANELISHNVNRYEKKLVTDNQNDEQVTYYLGDSQHEEGKFVANKIKELIKSQRYKYSDIAILYRNNYLSRFVETAFLNENIPYTIFGGVKFYQRKEIKDILAYLYLINNSEDELAIRRIINIPNRKIGDSTINKINQYALDHHLKFTDVLHFSKESHPDINWDSSKINNFFKLINHLKSITINKSPNEIAQTVIKEIKYEEYLSSYELPEDVISRMKNLDELVHSIKEYEFENENATLNGFLQSVTLLTDTTNNDNLAHNKNNVALMTIHVAKGTEMPVVFIIGLYDHVFPNDRGLFDNFEEERRIAFVGITRAKEKLFLTSNKGDSYVGRFFPSVFIEEIGDKHLKKITSHFDSISEADLSWYDSKKETDYNQMYSKKDTNISVNDTIVHTIFGLGVVLEVDGEFIKVAFKHPYGQKTLIKNHKYIKRVKN